MRKELKAIFIVVVTGLLLCGMFFGCEKNTSTPVSNPTSPPINGLNNENSVRITDQVLIDKLFDNKDSSESKKKACTRYISANMGEFAGANASASDPCARPYTGPFSGTPFTCTVAIQNDGGGVPMFVYVRINTPTGQEVWQTMVLGGYMMYAPYKNYYSCPIEMAW